MYVCTAVNALSFKIRINHETKTFSRLFHRHSHKIYLLALLGIFTDQTERFLYSCNSTSEIPTLSYTWSPKKVPLSGGASRYRPSKGVPPELKLSQKADSGLYCHWTIARFLSKSRPKNGNPKTPSFVCSNLSKTHIFLVIRKWKRRKETIFADCGNFSISSCIFGVRQPIN